MLGFAVIAELVILPLHVLGNVGFWLLGPFGTRALWYSEDKRIVIAQSYLVVEWSCLAALLKLYCNSYENLTPFQNLI